MLVSLWSNMIFMGHSIYLTCGVHCVHVATTISFPYSQCILSQTCHNMVSEMSHNFDTFSWKGLYTSEEKDLKDFNSITAANTESHFASKNEVMMAKIWLHRLPMDNVTSRISVSWIFCQTKPGSPCIVWQKDLLGL